MTLIKPTFSISHFKVFKGRKEVFDCGFHSGVNVIRGRNSSGKTTIMDLLAFSVGAENIRWKPEALSCSFTLVEVKLNGVKTCFKREISAETQRPLDIFWGSIEEAEKATSLQWEQYPFRRTANKLSFTQVIFNALDIPNAQGDGASNLTLHQILRVLYADQPSVHSPIFRIDNFDSALTKEMVGGYLCGVYDNDLYSSQLKLREIDSELSKKIASLKSIFSVLGRSGHSENIHYVDEKIKELEFERQQLNDELLLIKNGEFSGSELDTDQEVTKKYRKELNKAKLAYTKNIDEIERLQIEIADSELFIAELENRLQGLNQSEITRGFFGDLQFKFCPSCLEEIKHLDGNACHLCKNETSEDSSSQILRMKNEISLQLKESYFLLKKRNEVLANLKKELPVNKGELKQLEKKYVSVASVWDTPESIRVQQISMRLGTIDKEIARQYENKKLSDVINELQIGRDNDQAAKERLESLIETLINKEESRKIDVAKNVDLVMKRLLQLDLPLQPEFIEPQEVRFDFVENAVYVNGSKNFSESSAVVLRQLFHLALLTTSIEKNYMRLPRFLLLDGIDDGGMEKDRSHNLQKIIVDEASNYECEYQIIYATSEIKPEYEGSRLTVGRYFSPEARSLDV